MRDEPYEQAAIEDQKTQNHRLKNQSTPPRPRARQVLNVAHQRFEWFGGVHTVQPQLLDAGAGAPPCVLAHLAAHTHLAAPTQQVRQRQVIHAAKIIHGAKITVAGCVEGEATHELGQNGIRDHPGNLENSRCGGTNRELPPPRVPRRGTLGSYTRVTTRAWPSWRAVGVAELAGGGRGRAGGRWAWPSWRAVGVAELAGGGRGRAGGRWAWPSWRAVGVAELAGGGRGRAGGRWAWPSWRAVGVAELAGGGRGRAGGRWAWPSWRAVGVAELAGGGRGRAGGRWAWPSWRAVGANNFGRQTARANALVTYRHRYQGAGHGHKGRQAGRQAGGVGVSACGHHLRMV